MPPVDVAVLLNPDIVPWAGDETMVHVSVCPMSRSFIASNEVKIVVDRFWQAVRSWLAPPVKDGALFIGAPEQKTVPKTQEMPSKNENSVVVFIRSEG